MANLGGIYIYSYCSHYKGFYKSCYSILNIASLVIGTTSSTVIKIANRINRGFYKNSYRYYYRYYYKGYYKSFYKGCCGGNIGLVSSWWLPLGL